MTSPAPIIASCDGLTVFWDMLSIIITRKCVPFQHHGTQMVIEQMSICSFTISNDESPHLNGFKIEVLTMNDVGFRRDDSRLLNGV